MKSQKGFTLVELLAVIVVLAILMLVAGASVTGALENARIRQYRNEFLGLMQAARIKANLDMMDNKLTIKKNCECIQISQLETEGHFENPHSYTGSILLELDNSRKLTITGWMAGDTYMVVGKTEQVKEEEVESYESSFEGKASNCENKCSGS